MDFFARDPTKKTKSSTPSLTRKRPREDAAAKALAKEAKEEEKRIKALAKEEEKRIKALAKEEEKEEKKRIKALKALAKEKTLEEKKMESFILDMRRSLMPTATQPLAKAEQPLAKATQPLAKATQPLGTAQPMLKSVLAKNYRLQSSTIPTGTPQDFMNSVMVLPHQQLSRVPFAEYERQIKPQLEISVRTNSTRKRISPSRSKHFYDLINDSIVSVGFELQFDMLSPVIFHPEKAEVEFIYIPLDETKRVGNSYYKHCVLGEFETTKSGNFELSCHTDLKEHDLFSEPFYYYTKGIEVAGVKVTNMPFKYNVNWDLLKDIDTRPFTDDEYKTLAQRGKYGGITELEFHSLFRNIDNTQEDVVLKAYLETIRALYGELSKGKVIAKNMFITKAYRKTTDGITSLEYSSRNGFIIELPASSPMSKLVRVDGKKETVVEGIKYFVHGGTTVHKPQVTIGLHWEKFCEVRYRVFLDSTDNPTINQLVSDFPDLNDQYVVMHAISTVTDMHATVEKGKVHYIKSTEQCRHRLTEILNAFGFEKGSEKLGKLIEFFEKFDYKHFLVLYYSKSPFKRNRNASPDRETYDSLYEFRIPDLIRYLKGQKQKSHLEEFEVGLSVPQPFTAESRIILYEDRAYSSRCEQNPACMQMKQAIALNFSHDAVINDKMPVTWE